MQSENIVAPGPVNTISSYSSTSIERNCGSAPAPGAQSQRQIALSCTLPESVRPTACQRTRVDTRFSAGVTSNSLKLTRRRASAGNGSRTAASARINPAGPAAPCETDSIPPESGRRTLSAPRSKTVSRPDARTGPASKPACARVEGSKSVSPADSIHAESRSSWRFAAALKTSLCQPSARGSSRAPNHGGCVSRRRGSVSSAGAGTAGVTNATATSMARITAELDTCP